MRRSAILRTLSVLLLVSATLFAQEEQPSLLRIYGVGSLLQGKAPLRADPEFGLLQPRTFVDFSERSWLDRKKPRGEASSIAELLRSVAGDAIIESSGTRLIVRGSMEEHRRIGEALEALRRAGGVFEIEVLHLVLDGGAVNNDVLRLLGRAAEGKLDEAGRKKLIALDRRRGTRRGTLHAPQGRWTTFRAVREVRYVPEYDVEIAQASAIAEPQVYMAPDGLKAAVRPFLLQDGTAVMRIVASAGYLEDEMRRFDLRMSERSNQLRLRNTDYGIVEQSDYRGCAVSTEAAVAPGKSTGVAFGYDGSRFELLLFTVRRAPTPASAGTFMVVPIGVLATPDPTHALTTDADEDQGLIQLWPGESTARARLEEITRELRAPLENEDGGFLHASTWLHGGGAVVRARKENMEKVLATMKALEQAYLEPARVHVRLLRGERTIGLLSAPVLAGRDAAFAMFHRADYIGGYEVEVAQEARIAKPRQFVAYAGLFANLRLHRAGSSGFRLELDLEVRGMPEGIRTISTETGGIPLLQAVTVRKARTHLRLDLSRGIARELELGPDPFEADDGQPLRAVVTLGEP